MSFSPPNGFRYPSIPARKGVACYNCEKYEGVTLARCTGCLRIAYCSARCQTADWDTHKALCRALKKLEKENPQISPIEIPRTEPILDPGQLASLCDSHDQNMREVIERTMGRALEMHERSIIEWEPRCLVCPRTDQLLRFETGLSRSAAPRLIPCPQCNLSFCCSDAHWAAAQQLHHTSSQCELNHQVRADVVFEVAMASSGRDPRGAFIWAPTRLCTQFASLFGSDGWEAEFGDDLRKTEDLPALDPIGPWIRAMSVHLAMPMTILHALEKLNERSLAWTRKDLLTVHVMGATSNEIAADSTFEEILHRLPDVQTLKLVFCCPDMSYSGRVSTAKTCTDCSSRGRQRVNEFETHAYRDYMRQSTFSPPDLAIAFNSSATQGPPETWSETLAMLIAQRIPSVFLASDREEAETISRFLFSPSGARLIPGLGPDPNPWGSTRVFPQSVRPFGFYASNAWFVGGFRGP